MKLSLIPTSISDCIAIYTTWIFHISAAIGITLGYQQWFITKTPFTLLLIAGFLFWTFSITKSKTVLLFMGFAAVGYFAEFLGVNYGLIFGNYIYGNNLGLKISGVPFLISINWAVLIFITATIASQIKFHWLLQVVIGALLMVMLDVVLELSAPEFDYWQFEGGVPTIQNYIGWFAISLGLIAIFNRYRVKGNLVVSIHFYIIQLLYFGYFGMINLL